MECKSVIQSCVQRLALPMLGSKSDSSNGTFRMQPEKRMNVFGCPGNENDDGTNGEIDGFEKEWWWWAKTGSSGDFLGFFCPKMGHNSLINKINEG